MLIQAQGPSVRYALSAARRAAGLAIGTSRELLRSGHEDGLYRCELDGGAIVEVTIMLRQPASAEVVG
jgi:hypothetical protein